MDVCHLDPQRITRSLNHAYATALNSPDPSTQNGAVVLDHNGRLIGTGCNTFTLGVKCTPDLLERPKKYSFIEHAERNALYDAVRHGKKPYTMIAAWAACSDCARAIVGMGVKVLVRHIRQDDEGRWNESIEWGDQIMRAAGVEIIATDEKLGCDPVLFNGKLMYP